MFQLLCLNHYLYQMVLFFTAIAVCEKINVLDLTFELRAIVTHKWLLLEPLILYLSSMTNILQPKFCCAGFFILLTVVVIYNFYEMNWTMVLSQLSAHDV